MPVIGGDTTAARAARAQRDGARHARSAFPGRGGARPGDVLVVTGPLGAAGAAFREQRYVRPPLRLDEGRELAAHRARDARPLGRARRRRRAHRRALRLPARDRPRARPARARGDRRRPRLRRGLRAARRRARARAASPRSAAARRARASSSCSQASPRATRLRALPAELDRSAGSRSEPAAELLLEVRARPGADDGLLPLAALEEDHRRQREHAVVGRAARVLVDVHRHEADARRARPRAPRAPARPPCTVRTRAPRSRRRRAGRRRERRRRSSRR